MVRAMSLNDAAARAGVRRARVQAFDFATGTLETRDVATAIETPVEISYGGLPHAVMMATPADLEDFVIGFSFTEGVARDLRDLRAIDIETRADSVVVAVELASEALARHLARRRTLAGRTSCGLCGVETIEEIPQAEAGTRSARAISAVAIKAALGALDRHQPLNRLTRAVHAAAWCAPDGEVLTLREDVGRHNALDKLIGALARAGTDPATGFVVVTSRASYEMVYKAAHAGFGLLAAVSAPTGLAVRTAEAAGLVLAGFVRGDRAVAYSHARRLLTPAPAPVSSS